ncbi:16S rRNA (cytidine(1402)-2'-O)-methyltransferase [Patescibacteria group bacterium]
MSVLYLVSTPIGNLKDISLRALEILKQVDIVLAEDTRKTGLLLKHFSIPKKTLISFFEANENKRIPEVLKLMQEKNSIALVTNAGTPLISDPGYKLVRTCIEKGIKVESIPGASAVLTALTSSGLAPDKFLFLGFLPKKQGKKEKLLENIKKLHSLIPATIVCYLSPYRVVKDLKIINKVLGDINIVLARELTKIHEEIRREKVSESIIHFEKVKPKGEFVLLF